MSAFDEALHRFLAVARQELGIEASAKDVAFLMRDGLDLVQPDEETDEIAAQELAHRIGLVAELMPEALHAEA